MKRRLPVPLLIAGILAGCLVAILMPSPTPSGMSITPLPACPSSPNCVCSEDPDPSRRILPLAFTGSGEDAMLRLRAVIGTLPRARARVVAGQVGYLHVEFRTRFLRFVDDVEFRLDSAAQVIQMRSASRLGYSDLGTNRRRTEEIRTAFEHASDQRGPRRPPD